MAYNEALAERISKILNHLEIDYLEKKMFGGIAFMINDKMSIGIAKERLMLRVMDEKYAQVLELPGASEMDFTGRSLKGFVYVEDSAFNSDSELKKWIEYGVDFGLHGVVKTKKKSSKK